MKHKGVVKGGVIVLEKGYILEEGTIVEVEPANPNGEQPTLAEIFKDVAGKAVDLPSDMARNHDHYLHGVPRRTNK